MSPNQIPTIIIVIWNKWKFSFSSFLSSFFFSFSFPPFLFYSISTSSCELAKLYGNSILHVCNTTCWAIITSHLILTQCREEGTVISPVVQVKLRHRVLTQFANTTPLASGWTKIQNWGSGVHCLSLSIMSWYACHTTWSNNKDSVIKGHFGISNKGLLNKEPAFQKSERGGNGWWEEKKMAAFSVHLPGFPPWEHSGPPPA